MATSDVELLIGKGIISDSFRDSLLDERRAATLRNPGIDVSLGSDEMDALLAIEASDFREFSALVEQMLNQQSPAPEPRLPARAGLAMAGVFMRQP